MRTPSDSPRRAGGGPRGRLLTLCAVIGGVLGVLWAGCQVTPSNYKLLSFLFDGVPDPSMAGPAGNTAGGNIKQSPTYSVHQAFLDEKCEACHKGRLRPARNDSSACLECHADKPTEHAYMHGPVAAAACMWCHAPHESAYAALMRDADRKVCMQCHTPEMLSTEAVPEHADEARGCLECHTGHGGPAPKMLRAERRPAPAGR